MHDEEQIQRLIELLERLYDETHGFLQQEDQPQLWYNRGYANGMLQVLEQRGYGCRLRERVDPDPEEIAEPQYRLPWGKAYLHGQEMGSRECHDILEPKA